MITNLNLLYLANLINNFGAQLLTMTLAFTSYQTSGDGYMAGIILMIHYLPGGIISIFGGASANKFGLKNILLICHFIGAMTALAMFNLYEHNISLVFALLLLLKSFANQYFNVLRGLSIKFAFDKEETKSAGSKIQIGFTIGSALAGILCIFFHKYIDIQTIFILNIIFHFLALSCIQLVIFKNPSVHKHKHSFRENFKYFLEDIFYSKILFKDFLMSILTVGLIQAPLFYFRSIISEGIWDQGKYGLGIIHISTSIGIIIGLNLYKKFFSSHEHRFKNELSLVIILTVLFCSIPATNFMLGLLAILAISLLFEFIYIHTYLEIVAHAPERSSSTILCLRAGLAQAAAGVGSFMLGIVGKYYIIQEAILISSFFLILGMGLCYFYANHFRIYLLRLRYFDRRSKMMNVNSCRRNQLQSIN